METKVSKAQTEVWKWKDKAYKQIRKMPLDKGIEFILKQTQKTVEELERKRKSKSRK